jgi:hypothetical protein
VYNKGYADFQHRKEQFEHDNIEKVPSDDVFPASEQSNATRKACQRLVEKKRCGEVAQALSVSPNL